MTARLRRPAVTLAVIGLVLLGAAPAQAAGGTTPFKASFSGTAVLGADGASATYVGAGSATRLGRIATLGGVVVTGFDDTLCVGGLANTNTETLTDNDGDTLTITSDDVGCPGGSFAFHGFGSWRVSGGTGRFAGTSGHGSLDGYSDFAAGTFSITLTGTLAG